MPLKEVLPAFDPSKALGEELNSPCPPPSTIRFQEETSPSKVPEVAKLLATKLLPFLAKVGTLKVVEDSKPLPSFTETTCSPYARFEKMCLEMPPFADSHS